MNIVGQKCRGSRGMVLMSCLTILAVLLAVGLGTRVMMKNDYQALANLRVGTEAFYFSVAGIEWSKNEVARATAFPPAPMNQTKAFAGGSFAVTFLSPVATKPLEARVVARSAGSTGASIHTTQALLRKNYDLADAALVLRGHAARVNFSGASWFVSGAEHDPTNGNSLAGTKARRAVSLPDPSLYDLVTTALGNPPQPDRIDPASSNPSVALSDHLNGSAITQLANDLCAAPGVTVHALGGSATLTVDNQMWGTPGAPAIHCIEGNAAAGDSVNFTGTSGGAGILIVKSADLVLNGAFRWEGLIIISGQEVGLKVFGSSSKEVLGAVIIHESGTPGIGSAILDIQGSLRLLFSRQALNRSALLIPSPSLNPLYSTLPAYVSQEYWRSLSP